MKYRSGATPFLVIYALLAAPCGLRAQTASPAENAVMRIKDEGLNRSQVMQTLSYLTDVIGPRLTASPNMKRANEWTRDKLTVWGLQNAHLEPWGPFGRGWTLERFSMQVISPQTIPLIAYPKAWTTGLKGGRCIGDVVYVDARTEKDLETYRGKLKGCIVLSGPERPIEAHFTAQGSRLSDDQLARMEAGQGRRQFARGPGAGGPGGGRLNGGRPDFEQMRQRLQFAGRLMKFVQEEGAALVVEPSSRGDGGTLFVQSASVPSAVEGRSRRISPWDKKAPWFVPQVVMAGEHYNRLVRMVRQGEKLRMAVDLSVRFYDRDPMGYNTIGEIPGSDLKDEVVMVGAHMDSWHSGTGATDNGAGCAVAMEAVRIIQALNLKPRRTIRIGLWSGEEEGLLGSRAYVAEHFANRGAPPREETPGTTGARSGQDRAAERTPGSLRGPAEAGLGSLIRKPDYDRFSVYFNLDNGTGKIRGIYLQGNEAAGPIFKEWLAPFKEMGASTVTVANTGGTDHQSFDGVGLPGFQFIQDEIEYDTRTHHSNQDVYDRVQADDMKQASVIMATFLYNAAIRDEKIPRKPSARASAGERSGQ